ncbi:MAG: hypothetical protein WCE46_05535 [Methanoregula sp.]|jgi:hypothetical protein|uniref:hypothetical protein n=1 Tax=Methanoregula sp. TaxID=2052170 RepID=UPI003C754BB3
MSDKNQKIFGTAPAHTALESIDIDAGAKARLDHIKQAQNLQTDSEAIVFLYASWKKSIPSLAGALSGTGPWEREEDDPHRIPDDSDIK